MSLPPVPTPSLLLLPVRNSPNLPVESKVRCWLTSVIPALERWRQKEWAFLSYGETSLDHVWRCLKINTSFLGLEAVLEVIFGLLWGGGGFGGAMRVGIQTPVGTVCKLLQGRCSSWQVESSPGLRLSNPELSSFPPSPQELSTKSA